MNEWWTTQTAGLIGGIGGSAVGVLGGLLGAVGGMCAARGVGRRVVLGTMLVVSIAGIVALCVGLYAATIADQPYHVVFPMLLGGFVTATVFGGLLPVMRARYHDSERRRLEAEDLRRS